jgi:hypothetical protein
MTSDPAIAQYLTGWNEAIFARSLAGILALAFTLPAMQFLRGRRSLIAGFLWTLGALACLVFAIAPQATVTMVIDTEYLTRVRIIAGVISLVVLLITIETVRKDHLREQYALLWVSTSLVILTSALFPQVINLLRAAAGMSYPTAIVAVTFTFLLLVCFHFSLSFSTSNSIQARMAQRIALLETRLTKMEEILADKANGATPSAARIAKSSANNGQPHGGKPPASG